MAGGGTCDDGIITLLAVLVVVHCTGDWYVYK